MYRNRFALIVACALYPCAWFATTRPATCQKVQLVKDINLGVGKEPSSFISFLGTWKGKGFFMGHDSIDGDEPYVTDGTKAGTRRILEVRRGNGYLNAQKGFAVSKAFLFQTRWKDNSYYVVSTDGTEKGTFTILRSPSSRDKIKVLNQVAYVAGSMSSDSLQVTDGSIAGTKLVVQIGSSRSIDRLWVANGKLWMDVLTANARELWVSDGTAKGTKFVYQLSVPYKGERISALFGLNGKTYMQATVATKKGIWVTDGTSKGTSFVASLPMDTGSTDYWISTGKLFLCSATDSANGSELWVSDGTKSGTRMLKDINPGSSSSGPYYFRQMGKKILFQASTAKNGSSPWVTDGTSAGTRLIKAINGSSGGSSFQATVFGSRALFFTNDGKVGEELWVTDGTSMGTKLVKDIEPGSKGSNGWRLMPTSKGVYFSAATTATGDEPWFSDGTTAGTRLIRNVYPAPPLGSSAFALNSGPGHVFLSADDGKTGKELWISDGTSVGTRLLKDLYPGPGSSSPKKMIRAGNKWFFLADAPSTRAELWVTDGTSKGTRFLKDIRAGILSSYITWMTPFRGKLYFTADDGIHGIEIWVSDGTSAGTQLLMDIFPGKTESRPGDFFVLRDRLYFVANDLLRGRVLFVTDGTVKGTKISALAGKLPTPIHYLGSIGDKALLSSRTAAAGDEPWITDGTLAGTSLLKDIEPGKASSNPGVVTKVGGLYYFTAKTTSQGQELWVTDGSSASTKIAFEIQAGRGSSRIYRISPLGDKFLFTADKSYLQRSLFVSDGTPKGTVELKAWKSGVFVSVQDTGSGMQVRFLVIHTSVSGVELWRTDGTVSGTRLIQELAHGNLISGGDGPIQTVGARYVFPAIDALHGTELFYLDGLALSTRMGHPCGKDLPTLRVTNPELGKPVTFEGRSSPTGEVGVLCLGALPKSPLILGQGCELWFDLLGFYPLSTFAVTKRSWSLQVPVPASPSLSDKTFASQVIYLPILAGSGIQVSQGVMSRMH